MHVDWQLAISAVRIKVLVIEDALPKSEMETASKDNSYDIMKTLKEEHFKCELSRIKHDKGIKSGFAKVSEQANGAIYFDFVRLVDVSEDLNDFNTFNISNRYMGVLGFFGEEVASWALSKLNAASERVSPGTLLPRLGVVVGSQGAEALVAAADTSCLTLRTLPEVILSPRSVDVRLSVEQPQKLRERTPGRLAKINGDLYLLAGVYSVAINHFATATEESRSHSDLLWNAGAQEGMQIALALQNEQLLAEHPSNSTQNSVTSEDVTPIWTALPEKLAPLAAFYQKADMPILAFRIHQTMAALLSLHGKPYDAAMTLCQGWTHHRLMPFHDKLYALACTIGLFNQLSMRRKRAFFLQLLTNILVSNREEELALIILMKTFAIHNISLDGISQSGWTSLKCILLRRAAKLADGHKERRLYVEYICAMLAYGLHKIEPGEQIRWAKILRSRVRSERELLLSGPRSDCLLPLLKDLRIDESYGHFWRGKPVRKTSLSPDASSNQTFIYNPFQKRNTRDPVVVAVAIGESLPISVSLSNPFAFPIELVDLQISCTGCEYRTERIAVTLPARCEQRLITLSVEAHSAGSLEVLALDAIIFGVPMAIKKPSPTCVSIRVIERQPRLVLSDACQLPSCLSLFDGQEESLSLSVSNEGSVPINSMSVRFEPSCQPEVATVEEILHGISSFDDAMRLRDPLPSVIDEGQSSTIDFMIRAPLGWTGSRIIISYGGPSTDDDLVFERSLSVSVKATVMEAAVIKSMRIYPCRDQSSNSTVPSHQTRKEPSNSCLLALDLHNASPYHMVFSAEYDEERVGDRLGIDGGVTKRFVLNLPLFRIPQEQRKQLIPLEGRQIQALRSAKIPTESLDCEWFWIKRELMKRLTIRWTLPFDVEGHLSVCKVSVAPPESRLLLAPDFDIKVVYHYDDRFYEIDLYGNEMIQVHEGDSLDALITITPLVKEPKKIIIKCHPIIEDSIKDAIEWRHDLDPMHSLQDDVPIEHSLKILALKDCSFRMHIEIDQTQ